MTKILLPLAFLLALTFPAAAGPLGDSVSALEADDAAKAAQITTLQGQVATLQKQLSDQAAADAQTIADLKAQLAAATEPAPQPVPTPTPTPTPTPAPPSDSGVGVKCDAGKACQLVMGGKVWTITAQGQIAVDGVVDPVTSGVIRIEIAACQPAQTKCWTLYQENVVKDWYQWTPGSGFANWTKASGDPLAVPAPPAVTGDAYSAMLAKAGVDVQNNLTLAGKPSLAQLQAIAAHAGWFRISAVNNPPTGALNANALGVIKNAIATGLPVLATVESPPLSTDQTLLANTLTNAGQLAAWLKSNCSPAQCALQCTNETGFGPADMWGQTTGLQIAKRCIATIRANGWTGPIFLNVQLRNASGGYYPDGAAALKDVNPLPVDTDGTRSRLVISWHYYDNGDYQKQGTQDAPTIKAGTVSLPSNYLSVIQGAFQMASGSPPGLAGMRLALDEAGWPAGAPNQPGEVVTWGNAMTAAAKAAGMPLAFFAVNGGGNYGMDPGGVLGPAAVSVLDGSSQAMLDIRSYGAVSGQAIDAAFAKGAADAKAKGEALYIPAGTWLHSGVLRADSVAIEGAGASSILKATDPTQAALYLVGAQPKAVDLAIDGSATTRGTQPSMDGITIDHATGAVVQDVTVKNTMAAGIFNFGGVNTYIGHNTVTDTKADAIHNTAGASGAIVEWNRVERAGDDGVAVVSYGEDASNLVTGAVIQHNTVLNQAWGRNISVIGGVNIKILSNHVEGNGAGLAGIMLAQESSYNTAGVHNVLVQGNTVIGTGGANTGHGAIHIDSEVPGGTGIDRIDLESNDVLNPGLNGLQLTGSGKLVATIAGTRVYAATGHGLIAGNGQIVQSDNQLLPVSAYPGDKEPAAGGARE